jgi:hypothetical protein
MEAPKHGDDRELACRRSTACRARPGVSACVVTAPITWPSSTGPTGSPAAIRFAIVRAAPSAIPGTSRTAGRVLRLPYSIRVIVAAPRSRCGSSRSSSRRSSGLIAA